MAFLQSSLLLKIEQIAHNAQSVLLICGLKLATFSSCHEYLNWILKQLLSLIHNEMAIYDEINMNIKNKIVCIQLVYIKNLL